MSKATETAVKLLESLPESVQEQVVEKLRRRVEKARDEARWNELFARSNKLRAAARMARQELAAGKASDMDCERL